MPHTGESIITSFSANETVADESLQKKTPGEIVEPRFSLQQPCWHVIVLSVTTVGVYWIYWCYKNWRDLSKHFSAEQENPGGADVPSASTAGTNAPVAEPKMEAAVKLGPNELANFKGASPLLRSVGLFFPYINNYLFFTLALGIARLHPDRASFVASRPIICSLAIALAYFATQTMIRLPGAFCMLFLLGAVPTAIAQHWLNRYWNSIEERGLLVRHGFSLLELISIIIGALVLGFIATSFMLGISK